MKTIFLLASLFVTVPVFAQETVWLNVNQTHSVAWHWENTEGPVRSFVFKCGQYVKELEADARSLRFGSLVDEPGRYSGCTLAAKNEAGESMPVPLPAFEYAYSYGAFGRLILELAATLSAGIGVLTLSARQALSYIKCRKQAPLALPEPLIILEKARDHVRHYS